jgi:hypothetical protein
VELQILVVVVALDLILQIRQLVLELALMADQD